MDAAGDAGSGGAGGAAGGGADAAAGGASQQSAAVAATGATGGSADVAGASSGNAAGSVLGAGANGAASAAVAPADFIPEKYRVTKDDGALDIEASARKLAEAHGSLEKRLGAGDAPPKAATEYQVAVPETLKEAFGDLNADPMFTQFRNDMHGLGLTQKQFDGVMSRYFELVPQLVQGGSQLTSEQTVATLKEKWADDNELEQQIGLSYRAANKIAQAAGMSYEDVEKSGLGNNPTFIRLMAAIGPEFSEDAPVQNNSAGFMSDDAVKELMMSEANTNPKHPQHKATRARIDAYYERKYGNQTIA
jgi:hypothetical protein